MKKIFGIAAVASLAGVAPAYSAPVDDTADFLRTPSLRQYSYTVVDLAP